MHLDVGTLSVVTVFVTALLGALLVFAGMQNRSIRAPIWWGAAQIVGAIGLALVTARGSRSRVRLDRYRQRARSARLRPDSGRARASSTAARCCRSWSSLRRFSGCWRAGSRRLPKDANLRVVVVSTMMAMLAAATAEEFWRGRDEPLMSRWPTVIVLLAYSVALLARIPATYFSPILRRPRRSWAGSRSRCWPSARCSSRS